MDQDVYYNMKEDSFAERESFNNTILLLTLVKSRYYYIVGFSRPANVIEIAFDYESDLHAAITESIIMDFRADDEWVLIQATLKNVTAASVAAQSCAFEGSFRCDGERVVYEYKVKKDKLIPTAMEVMNACILKAKAEIIAFLEACYAQCLAPAENKA